MCVCVCVCMLVCVGQREGMAACARVHRLLVGDFFVFVSEMEGVAAGILVHVLFVCVCVRERETASVCRCK